MPLLSDPWELGNPFIAPVVTLYWDMDFFCKLLFETFHMDLLTLLDWNSVKDPYHQLAY